MATTSTNTVVQWGPEERRYSILSAVTLLLFIVSPLPAYYAILSPINWVRAIGFLVIPFAFFCWIFTTIRAIHMRAVRFWLIPSTYVSLSFGLFALIIAWIGGLVANGEQHDLTLLISASFVIAGAFLWSLWYNWKRTESILLAISLTLIQSLASFALMGWLCFKYVQYTQRNMPVVDSGWNAAAGRYDN